MTFRVRAFIIVWAILSRKIIITESVKKFNMRMRKKKHCEQRISLCADLMTDSPADVFGAGTTLSLEIGCGKGKFICDTAALHPDRRYIAVEKVRDVILLAMERAKGANIENVRFANCDAVTLGELFPPDSVECVYLNFNDPWPKNNCYKRRLTYVDFLNIYKKFLRPGGEIRLKTDNVPYFDFSLRQLERNGFELRELTRDLHNSEYDANNVRTEFEERFSSQGIPICSVKAVLLPSADIVSPSAADNPDASHTGSNGKSDPHIDAAKSDEPANIGA